MSKISFEDYLKMDEDEQFEFLSENSWNEIDPTWITEEDKENYVQELIEKCSYEDGDYDELLEIANKSLNNVIKRYTHGDYVYIENYNDFEEDLNLEFRKLLEEKYETE